MLMRDEEWRGGGWWRRRVGGVGECCGYEIVLVREVECL